MSNCKNSTTNNFVYILLISYIQLLDFRYSKFLSYIQKYHALYGLLPETKPWYKRDKTEKQKNNDFFQLKIYGSVTPEFNILYNIIYFIRCVWWGILLTGTSFFLFVSGRPVGRPKRSYPTKLKSFCIRRDLAEQLEADAKIACIPQRNIIEVALERYFNLSGMSDIELAKKEQELERELNNIRNTKYDRALKEKQEQERKEKEEKDALELFRRFCSVLEIATKDGIIPPLKNINKTYGFKLTDEKFQRICTSHQKGQFTIEDFKRLRSGEVD